MTNHQLINQTSGKTEYFTPQPIIEAARGTMGEIDLDPASSVEANKRVRAGRIYTQEDDGLSKDWCCKLVIRPDIVSECEIKPNSIYGRAIGKIRLHLIPPQNPARDATIHIHPHLNFSTLKEQPLTVLESGAEHASLNTQSLEQESKEPRCMALKSIEKNKLATEKEQPELSISASAASWIMLLNEHGFGGCQTIGERLNGNNALLLSAISALTAERKKSLESIILSLYHSPDAPERWLQMSFQPVEAVIHPNETDRQYRGVKTPLQYNELVITSIVYPARLWQNHPFNRTENPLWINKLVSNFESGNIAQACCITFASTSEKWFKPLLYYPQCFLVPRTEYLLPDGSKMRGVTKGSVVTYLGPNTDRFAREFGGLGVVKVRYQPATSSLPFQPQ